MILTRRVYLDSSVPPSPPHELNAPIPRTSGVSGNLDTDTRLKCLSKQVNRYGKIKFWVWRINFCYMVTLAWGTVKNVHVMSSSWHVGTHRPKLQLHHYHIQNKVCIWLDVLLQGVTVHKFVEKFCFYDSVVGWDSAWWSIQILMSWNSILPLSWGLIGP